MGLHGALYLSEHPGRVVTTREMAEAMVVSEHHLSKVMGRLVKEGLVKSVRGPSGGFSLNRNRREISLLEVYEAIEDPISTNGCLFDKVVCDGQHCLLGGLIGQINHEVRQYLSETKLGMIAGIFNAQGCGTK
jgi:Rrf2 family protein